MKSTPVSLRERTPVPSEAEEEQPTSLGPQPNVPGKSAPSGPAANAGRREDATSPERLSVSRRHHRTQPRGQSRGRRVIGSSPTRRFQDRMSSPAPGVVPRDLEPQTLPAAVHAVTTCRTSVRGPSDAASAPPPHPTLINRLSLGEVSGHGKRPYHESRSSAAFFVVS